MFFSIPDKFLILIFCNFAGRKHLKKKEMIKKVMALTLLALLPAAESMAGEEDSLKSSLNDIKYAVSAQAAATDGSHTPLWLNANRYGLSSLNTQNAYARVSLRHDMDGRKLRKWDWGYCVDLAGAFHYTSDFIIQQLYAEGRWHKGVLTIGSKEWPIELKNGELSSGPQTLGKNARPVPQVRVALPDYWTVPGTRGWVALKGHIAFGKMTDDKWQKRFTREESKYTAGTLYHSKAGYIRIGGGRKAFPLSIEMGLEMGAQFGGTSYHVLAEGGQFNVIKNPGGLKAFWDAFVPGGSDAPEHTYQNVSGNQLGSWVFRINFDQPSWNLAVYGDHFFEDHSGMFFLDYDGYGQGPEWNDHKTNRYLLYALKDMMLGAELSLKRGSWVRSVVLEYLYSKYQSGPIYHDHNSNISDHIGGRDDYYNHYIYTGWQHWGQVMGNPLYLSPLYNDDGKIEVKNNRLYAFHLGLSGDPSPLLHYRVLATWQKGFGRYSEPYSDPRENVSLLAEASYRFSPRSRMDGWSLTAAVGIDRGHIYGDNCGMQLTVTKTGILNKKRKK